MAEIDQPIWPDVIRRIARRVKRAGGRPMVVGGTVIDLIEGETPQDWDIEVFGLSMESLEIILEDFNPQTCGQHFGIIKIHADGIDIDVGVPRRDNSTGKGHRDFRVSFDPEMTLEEAAERRDFTINSMFIYICSDGRDEESRGWVDTIHDPFGGLDDWLHGRLKVTCEEKFRDDPLRGLRAMQLSARKAKTVDPETVEIIRSMDMDDLPRERLFPEWEKLLMLSDRPSIGLEFLDDCGWLRFFPELWEMKYWSGWSPGGIGNDNSKWRAKFDAGCPQNPAWHPEGNVWVHTLKVVDEAARVRHKVDEEWRLAFMFAALLHDAAKPYTTVLPECTAHGHETAGGAPTRVFMERLTGNAKLIDRTVSLVVNHLQPFQLCKEAKPSAWNRLHGKARLDVLGWLSRADWAGRRLGRSALIPSELGARVEHRPSKLCFEWYRELGKEPIEPKLKGRHLIEFGMEPGPKFKAILDDAFQIQLDNPGLTTEELWRRADSIETRGAKALQNRRTT